MAEAEVIIALRTFSGPNLGAEVMLPPGMYVIGTDYSCDVVLSDSSMAPRHALLTAEQPQPGQIPRLHVKPLDGDILLEEEPLPGEGREIPPATPWFLGLTCLSWNTPRAPREEIIPRLPGLSAQAQAQKAEETPEAHEENASGPKEVFLAPNEVGRKAPALLPRRRWPVRLLLALLLLVLGAMAFEFQRNSDSTEELAVKLRQEILEAGLDKVELSSENERITVSGSVLNEKERGLLWSMARNLKCPVYIKVGVQEDMAQAVKMKLNSSGIFPEVTFPKGGESMHIAAYIKDPQTENSVFASLNKDLPGLPKIEKKVVHAAQLKAFIVRELERERLKNITIALETGRVGLTDSSLSGNHNALQTVMKKVEEELKIPLAYTVISQDSPPSPEAAGEPQTLQPLVPTGISADMPAVSPVNSTLGDLHITGVTMGSMRFVSLDNGQRVFEGGVLPGGHILQSISLDTLILNKNGRTTTYPLRGNNE